MDDKWLVRTSTNFIYGPFQKEKLLDLIQGGRFNLHDEVCKSSSYWFFLNEREEVKKMLGIDITDLIPKGVSEDEVTQTFIERESLTAEQINDYEQNQEEDFAERPLWYLREKVLKWVTWFLTFIAFFLLFVVIQKMRK